jgi:hypothetical protein
MTVERWPATTARCQLIAPVPAVEASHTSEAPSAVRKVPAVRHANLISSPVVPVGGAPSSTV